MIRLARAACPWVSERSSIGGGLEPGETVKAALFREIREALGEELRIEKLVP